MKKSVLLLILTAMAITASACNGSDVTGTMTMNSSAKQEAKSTEASIAGNETSQNTTTTSSAVTELDNMLNEINTDVQPGTAGSSLKTVKVAANLLDWGTETSLSQEEIKSETVRWLSDKETTNRRNFPRRWQMYMMHTRNSLERMLKNCFRQLVILAKGIHGAAQKLRQLKLSKMRDSFLRIVRML